ncbi:MAG: hypothetical protein Q4D58_07245 [Synergistaceae bacterium]|nr:hypothetical protein [Synergistaceae bacterium]
MESMKSLYIKSCGESISKDYVWVNAENGSVGFKSEGDSEVIRKNDDLKMGLEYVDNDSSKSLIIYQDRNDIWLFLAIYDEYDKKDLAGRGVFYKAAMCFERVCNTSEKLVRSIAACWLEDDASIIKLFRECITFSDETDSGFAICYEKLMEGIKEAAKGFDKESAEAATIKESHKGLFRSGKITECSQKKMAEILRKEQLPDTNGYIVIMSSYPFSEECLTRWGTWLALVDDNSSDDEFKKAQKIKKRKHNNRSNRTKKERKNCHYCGSYHRIRDLCSWVCALA